MPKCVLHPGRDSVIKLFSMTYCQVCMTGFRAAQGRVDRHVEPKECFIWYKSNDNWVPIPGTGCAHWVSHQLSARGGGASDQCLAGFTYRVPVLVRTRTQIATVALVKEGDIWASPTLDHTGLVVKVTPPATKDGVPTLTIKHDSSRQGGVAENDFATYFHGNGAFYR